MLRGSYREPCERRKPDYLHRIPNFTYNTMAQSTTRKIILALSLTIATALVGCTSLGRLERDHPPPDQSETVYVLGLSPENYRVFIFPGEIKEETYHQNLWVAASYYGGSVDGYIIAKAKAGDTLGITAISSHSTDNSLLGRNFLACGDQKTITFTATPGGVIYLGDVIFSEAEDKLEYFLRNNFAAAKRNLESKHPRLGSLLTQQDYTLHRTNNVCQKDKYFIYVPVHLPKR